MKMHYYIHQIENGKYHFRNTCNTVIKNGCMSSSDKKEVTCKRCLKIINKGIIPPQTIPQRREIEHDMQASALGKHNSISEWECAHGRGFWGSAAHGYTYDKDNK